MRCVPRCVAAQPLMVYAAHAYAEGFVDTAAEGYVCTRSVDTTTYRRTRRHQTLPRSHTRKEYPYVDLMPMTFHEVSW